MRNFNNDARIKKSSGNHDRYLRSAGQEKGVTLSQKSKPHGVGGWLIPLIGYLGIFRPLAQFLGVSASLTIDAQTEQSLGTIWTIYEFCNWSIAAFGIGGCLFLTYRLVFVRR